MLRPDEQARAQARLSKMPEAEREKLAERMDAMYRRGLEINPNPEPLQDGVVSKTPF